MSTINFIQYGKQDGFPVFVLHGFPGSSLQGMIFKASAEKLGCKIISPDRPGYGKTRVPGDALVTNGLQIWTDLFKNFLKSENISKFGVIGISGGAPYAVAIAAEFPEQTQLLGLICPLGSFEKHSRAFSPYQKRMLQFYKVLPLFIKRKLIARLFFSMGPEKSVLHLANSLSQKDQEILRRPEVMPAILQSLHEGLEQKDRGILFDLEVFSRPWKIPWSNIKAKTILWHGTDDFLLNSKMSEELQKKIPHATYKKMPGEGHYSLPILMADSILKDFISLRDTSDH